MSTVIKATDRGASIHGVAFSFTDIGSEANRQLDRYRGEAGQILAEARRQAEQIRRRAETEGHQAAQQVVRQELSQQQARQMATLMPALTAMIADIRGAKQAWLSQWERSAIHVAAAIASRLVRRELVAQPEIPMALVREALELATGSDRLRVRLNPADHQTLAPHVEMLLRELNILAPAEVVADPAISRGGCRVETQFGVIDQQFEAQLARIEEELT